MKAPSKDKIIYAFKISSAPADLIIKIAENVNRPKTLAKLVMEGPSIISDSAKHRWEMQRDFFYKKDDGVHARRSVALQAMGNIIGADDYAVLEIGTGARPLVMYVALDPSKAERNPETLVYLAKGDELVVDHPGRYVYFSDMFPFKRNKWPD